mgnify:CR=1 FL=1
MKELSDEDLKHLALISRLELTDVELQELKKDLNDILKHFSSISHFNAKRQSKKSKSGKSELRSDVSEEPEANSKILTSQFIETDEEGSIVVPKSL